MILLDGDIIAFPPAPRQPPPSAPPQHHLSPPHHLSPRHILQYVTAVGEGTLLKLSEDDSRIQLHAHQCEERASRVLQRRALHDADYEMLMTLALVAGKSPGGYLARRFSSRLTELEAALRARAE